MSKRNYGIDLLRCVSMMLVVVLHVLGQGKILATVTPGTLNYNLAWFLETIAYCAVNCYALISGYVGIKARHKFRNITITWLQVAFYTVSISLLFLIFDPASIDSKGIISSFFPVMNRAYWYFTAYFALFFLIPILNAGINALNKNDAKKIVAAIIGVFSIIRLVLCFDIFDIFILKEPFIANNGYCVLWLILLYIVGGCIGKFDFWKTTKAWKVWVVFWSSILISWIFKIFIENPSNKEIKDLVETDALINYLSPTIIATAICLLVLFSRMGTLPKTIQKIVGFFAPSAFSVYIIHENIFFRKLFIDGKFSHYADMNAFKMLLCVLVTVLIIYISCSLIDRIRILLFKLVKVKEIIDKIADFKINKKET